APGARSHSPDLGVARLRGCGERGSRRARTAWSSFRKRRAHADGGGGPVTGGSRFLNPSGDLAAVRPPATAPMEIPRLDCGVRPLTTRMRGSGEPAAQWALIPEET